MKKEGIYTKRIFTRFKGKTKWAIMYADTCLAKGISKTFTQAQIDAREADVKIKQFQA